MWQYNLDLWSPTLVNNKYLTLIIVINCTKMFDPGSHSSTCILPTMFFYYVTISPWPLTTDLEKEWTSISQYADQLYQVVRSCTYTSFCILPTTFSSLWQYDHFLWSLTLKTLSIFLSSWWSIVPSCMILKLTVLSVSRLQCFPTLTLTSDLEKQ